MYLPLYHEKIFPWDEKCSVRVTDEEWAAFRSAHDDDDRDDEWWEWDGPHPNPGWGAGGFQGRFSGCPDGLQEFIGLAESAALVLGECGLGEEAFADSHGDWLWFLHQIAFTHQIPLLRSDMSVWGYDDLPAPDEFDVIAVRWVAPKDGETRHPEHPLVLRLEQSVFVSSVTAIEAILDPGGTITTNEPMPWVGGGVLNVPTEPERSVVAAEHPTCDKDTKPHDVGADICPNRFVIDNFKVRITFAGKESGTFGPRLGMRCWATILRTPYQKYQPIDFLIEDRQRVAEESGKRIDADEMSCLMAEGDLSVENVEKLDDREYEQRKQLRAWIRSLEADREEARQDGDFDKIKEIDARLRGAREFPTSIFNEFSQKREFIGESQAITDRKRVRANFKRCLTLIQTKMPLLGDHLERSWKFEDYVSYEPETKHVWEVIYSE